MAKNENIDKERIFVQKTAKKLIELKDRLQPAEGEKLHRNNLHSEFSKIRVNVRDYSNGKGDKSIHTHLNLDPDTVLFLADRIVTLQPKEPFEYFEEKINTHAKDKEGRCPVTKFALKHIPTMNNPWTITVETGIGQPEENENGGFSCKKGTFVSEVLVTNYMTDRNIYAMFTKAARLIKTFEYVMQMQLIEADLQAKEANKQKTEEKKAG